MKKSNLMPTIVLGCICLIAALLLSVINTFTSPRILAEENRKAQEALAKVLPEGSDFQSITLNDRYPKAVTEAYSAKGGYVFRAVGKGRNGDIIVMVGIDTDGKITGTEIISEGESKGYKERVFNVVLGNEGKYTGQTLDSFEPVIVAKSTLTSNGFANAVKAALEAFLIANDGSTPEQTLQNNCNAALGTENKKFTSWFATEVLDGIDGVYIPEDKSGYVFVAGESFIGVSTSGDIITEGVNDDLKTKTDEAFTLITSSTLTDTYVPEGLEDKIVSAQVTETGNYVFVAYGDGYGIFGGYHNSGESLKVKISISADGKILSTKTEYHSETENIGGAALENPDFYESFNGKDSTSFSDVQSVSGATLTCNGYKEAIENAFKAFELLTAEGGNE